MTGVLCRFGDCTLTRLIGGTPALNALRHLGVKAPIGLRPHQGRDLAQHLGAIGLHPHVGGKAPHGKVFFDGVHVNVRPTRGGVVLRELGQPGHIDIQQQAQVRTGQGRAHIKARKTRRAARDVEGAGAELIDAQAAQQGQVFQRRHRLGLAPQIRRDGDGLFGTHQLVGNRLCARRVNAAGQHGTIALGAESPHF